MSETPRGPGWWLAADGRWYPPELHPSLRSPPPPPPPRPPSDPGAFHPGAPPVRRASSPGAAPVVAGPTAAAPWAAAGPPPGAPGPPGGATPPFGVAVGAVQHAPIWSRPVTWVAVATIVVASVLGVVLGLLASTST